MVDLLGRPSCVDCFGGCLRRDVGSKDQSPIHKEMDVNMGMKGQKSREGSPAINELEQRLGIVKGREGTPIFETDLNSSPKKTPLAKRYSVSDGSPLLRYGSREGNPLMEHGAWDGGKPTPVPREYKSSERGSPRLVGINSSAKSPVPRSPVKYANSPQFTRFELPPESSPTPITPRRHTQLSPIAASPSPSDAGISGTPQSTMPHRTVPVRRGTRSSPILGLNHEESDEEVPMTPDLVSDTEDTASMTSRSEINSPLTNMIEGEDVFGTITGRATNTRSTSVSSSSPTQSSLKYDFDRPPTTAPATTILFPPASPRFGSSTACPGCKKIVSLMEKGVVQGPKGTRWHAACLVCGGKGKRKGDEKPGCGKKLDSGAKGDGEGGVWCRECLVCWIFAV
jgi:hypothetical protein